MAYFPNLKLLAVITCIQFKMSFLMIQISNKLVLLVIVHLRLRQGECITVCGSGGVLKHNSITFLMSNLSLLWREKLKPFLSAYVTDYGTVLI